MRSRFLSIDFFQTLQNQTTISQALQNQTTISHLSIPQLVPPSDLPIFGQEFASNSDFDLSFVFDLNLDLSFHLPSQIDPFPFQNALSHFLSLVLPSIYNDSQLLLSPNENSSVNHANNNEKRRNSKSEVAEVGIPEKENICYVVERDENNGRNLISETPDHEIIEENDFPVKEKNISKFGPIQFEVPEVDFPLVENPFDGKEEKKICFEIQGFETPMGISKSIYSVEDMTVECYMDSRSLYEEVPDKRLPYGSKIVNFEVGEIGFDLYTCPSIEEEFHSLLSNIRRKHWARKDNIEVDCKELLGSEKIEILECLSQHSKQCPEPVRPSTVSLLDMDYMGMTDNINQDRYSLIHSRTSERDPHLLSSGLQFHEVEILDSSCFEYFHVFASSQLANNMPETADEMLKEDISASGSFYESMVNIELSLLDDAFKSLPIPFFCEDREMISFSAVIEDTLDDLKVQRASACDGIYLDWHLMQEEPCSCDICSAYIRLLSGIDMYDIAADLQYSDDRVVIDFVLLDDTTEELNSFQCNEMLNDFPFSVNMQNEHLTKPNSDQLLEDADQISKSGEPVVINPDRISLLLESLSQFNDLNFFLKARKGNAGKEDEDAIKEKTDSRVTVPAASTRESVMTGSQEVTFQIWKIEVHHIKLSDSILDLINSIQNIYSVILKNETDLKKKAWSFEVIDDSKLLSLPKQILLDLITGANAQGTTLSGEDETRMAYIALYACKQIAHYLCFFGIHSSYLYLSNLCQTLSCLRTKLSPLLSLIEDSYWKAENGIIESHPSLSVIKEMIRSNISQNGKKVLIVADKAFWWPLNGMLTSMKLLFHEVNINSHSDRPNALESDNVRIAVSNALLQSDCLVISNEHIFPFFPFNKFSIILEYGGSQGSSRIATIRPELVGLPCLHFLKVELEEFSVPKELAAGLDASHHFDYKMESISKPPSGLREYLSSQQIARLLNFVPIMEKDGCLASFGGTDTVEPCYMPNKLSSAKFSTKSEGSLPCMTSFRNSIVIVNTQNNQKEMLISRRSSYQNILAMEKRGMQVIEREFSLPVDLIISADTCLVWYDSRNILMNATCTDNALLRIPEYMENIATNILMSLSCAFTGCAMVFEGESSFLTMIMESSDGLYAAAASLDIQLQLFCSYSSDSTDEIILNCIRNAAKLNNGLYPGMLESETLAESFLTRFPSINPISAHAILSTIGMLVEFLDWSHEQRTQAIRKYHVPNESMILFSSLCRYGELGESKSGMTDCSSTLSSALDSDHSSSKMQSQVKRQKYSIDTRSLADPAGDCFYFDHLNGSKDCSQKPSKPSSSSKPSSPYQSINLPTDHEISNMFESLNFPLKDQVLYQKKSVETFVVKDFDWDTINIDDNVHDDGIGKVLENSTLFLDDDFSIVDTGSFKKAAPQTIKEVAVRNNIPIRQALGKISHPTFPTSAEIASDSDIWPSLKDHSQIREDSQNGTPDTETSIGALPLKYQEEFFEESKVQKSTRNALGLSIRQKVTPPYGEIPPSNPTHGSRQGSPWKIEFLNGVQERAGRHQGSLPCNTCTDHSGSFRNMVGTSGKRQSPSSLDNYRYLGGSKTRKKIQNNGPKKLVRPLNSVNNEKKSLTFVPTWTPAEKRARQTLSFARSGSEKQSKLVWSDSRQSLKRRHREEA